MKIFDVAIVGGGPGGSACAAFCAAVGLRTLLLEREKFPREKVCGDCLNPSCWPILRRLEIAERVGQLPHAILDAVEFIAVGGPTMPYVNHVYDRRSNEHWKLETEKGERFSAHLLVAADGRNSTVARLC